MIASLYPQSSSSPFPPFPSDDPNPVKQEHWPVVVSHNPLPEQGDSSLVPFVSSPTVMDSMFSLDTWMRGTSPCSVRNVTKKELPEEEQRVEEEEATVTSEMEVRASKAVSSSEGVESQVKVEVEYCLNVNWSTSDPS